MDNGGSDAGSLGMGYEATASDPFVIDDDAKGGDREKKGLRAFRACESRFAPATRRRPSTPGSATAQASRQVGYLGQTL